jgi:dihydropyrimidine dehydrogenase (NAD+) subunit PreA
LGYKVVAEINPSRCINCGLCYIACEDGAHQSIKLQPTPVDQYLASFSGHGPKQLELSGKSQYMSGLGDGSVNVYTVVEESCVGCNLCSFVCPVSGCIEMVQRPSDTPPMTWRQYQQKLAAGEIEPLSPPVHVKQI